MALLAKCMLELVVSVVAKSMLVAMVGAAMVVYGYCGCNWGRVGWW